MTYQSLISLQRFTIAPSKGTVGQ